MKKLLSVFIPLILLTATAGVYVVNHYCMITGKTTANYTCCSRCNDECCKKEIKVVRLSFESVKESESKILSAVSFIPFFCDFSCRLPLSINDFSDIKHFPVKETIPLLIVSTSVLRI